MHHRHTWHVGELCTGRWKSGASRAPPPDTAEPFAVKSPAEWRAASLDSGTNARVRTNPARALAGGEYEQALASLVTPSNAWARRWRFGQQSASPNGPPRVQRGPRSATRAHPAGLTAREAEILDLVAAGAAQRRDRRAPVRLAQDHRSPRFGNAGQAGGASRTEAARYPERQTSFDRLRMSDLRRGRRRERRRTRRCGCAGSSRRSAEATDSTVMLSSRLPAAWDGVGDDDLFDGALAQPLDRRAAQHAWVSGA